MAMLFVDGLRWFEQSKIVKLSTILYKKVRLIYLFVSIYPLETFPLLTIYLLHFVVLYFHIT